MAQKLLTIAIDGPAGAGKSTIAKGIAKQLGIVYMDTGAMYRAMGLKAKRLGTDPDDWETVAKLKDNTTISISHNNSGQLVYLDGEDVTNLIRTADISNYASKVSAVPAIRMFMVSLQQDIAKGISVCMDGRDIGTFVLPNANVKVFLTASVDERARRRYQELLNKGEAVAYCDVRADIIQRDRQDTMREFAPLKQAEDAHVIDTTGMNVEQVISEIIALTESYR